MQVAHEPKLLGIALATWLCLALTTPATVETHTWNGIAGSDWFAAANWTPAGPPSAGDAVIFKACGRMQKRPE